MAEKKYLNKGAFMTEVDKMIVVDEEHLDIVEDPVIKEKIKAQLEVKLPVDPDKVGSMLFGCALVPRWTLWYLHVRKRQRYSIYAGT